ncbi:MAG: extracellular solute-binding protein [Bacilli bacterium]|nr:extracellular solute-binding protein [Bacilli bacterium]
MKKDKRYFGKTLMFLMILFFYLPIVFMIIFSFNSSKSLTHFTGFSLQWYQRMLNNSSMMESLYTTIIVAVVATIVSTIVGTISAIGLSKSKKIIRDLIMQINDFPIMNPEIVTAIGLMLFFITIGVERGFATLLIAHIAFCIPYVMLSVMPKIRSLDPNLADAAMDLGCTPWQALTKVIVPQIMPGIVSGALIAFTMSFDDFIISYFVTGKGIKNLSIMVYTMSKRVNPSINAISTLIVIVITVVLVIVNVMPIIKEKQRKKNPEKVSKNTGMKVGIGFLCTALILCTVFFNSSSKSGLYEGQTLHVYMPGEYINEEIVYSFEEETGADVVIDLFDSNEQMYIKVANGESYDILIPSDYMIERLISEELLQELDQSQLDCLDLINDAVKGLSYDKNNTYSIPYFWGSVGIVYDKTIVSEEDLEKEGFNIFLDEKYRGDIYLYDSERDSFMMALKALGYSMNTSNDKELDKAYQWLVQCATTMDAEIVTDEIIDNMVQQRKALGIVYSGDAAYIMSENENIGFYMPETGTNLWSDAMVIPKTAKNTDLALEFMNYITQYDSAYENSSYVGYTSPNVEVMDELSITDFDGINAYTPRTDNSNDEIFTFDEKTRKKISNYWSKVKIEASNAN